jgi:hypothetical protein
MLMEYKLLKKLCKETHGEWLDQDKEIFISGTNSLVIGPYDYLRTFATNLRVNAEGQNALLNRSHPGNPNRKSPVRFGKRSTDVIPTGDIMKGGYKKLIKGKEASQMQLEELNKKLAERKVIIGVNTISEDVAEKYRLTDIFTEASDYFSSITLESHHIVEKSVLGAINKNINELENWRAPCVLIMGELHRRFYSPTGTKFRADGKFGETELRDFYKKLYNNLEFADLDKIAGIIIDEAFPAKTPNKLSK